MSGSDSNPTYAATNHDMLGLKTLQVLDVDDLHILATCLITYRGHRVIAQSIIPGILNNTDQSSLTEYGSVDEGKTIHTNPEFHDLMGKLSEHLYLRQVKVKDDEGKVHEVAGSTEVKGIRGSDKRKYLLDLLRLTPRDANFKDESGLCSCLLRPELLLIYQRTKNIEYAQEIFKKQKEEKPEEKSGEEETKEEKQKAAIEQMKNFEKAIK